MLSLEDGMGDVTSFWNQSLRGSVRMILAVFCGLILISPAIAGGPNDQV